MVKPAFLHGGFFVESIHTIRWLPAVIILIIALSLFGGCGETRPLLLATTTSVQDSGLLDKLLPVFEKEYKVKVKPIAVGTGEALEMGRRGDADVLFVHEKSSEEEFVKEGYGLERVEIAWNDFVIVGPYDDPARIRGMRDASKAFAQIGSNGATFISRGDDSGTNKKELALWKQAGISPSGNSWYIDAGQGMGEVLTIASEKQGYTLSDRATFAFMKNSLRLEILVEGDKTLVNPYSVIVVNPRKFPKLKLNTKAAGDFVWFLTGKNGQKIIGEYKKEGLQLFHPAAKKQVRGLSNLH